MSAHSLARSAPARLGWTHAKTTLDTRKISTRLTMRGVPRINRRSAQAEPRNSTRRALLHLVFELGVIAKGVDGALELIGGFLLAFLPPPALRGIVLFLVQGELREDPTDLIANLLLHNASTVISARTPASAFLIAHGVVKLALVGGLAANRLWAYPAAIVVFAGFAIYQLCQLAGQYSLFLAVITVLDVGVVLLIAAEYRNVSPARAGRA
jgi:uncharacterized membrane protein